MGVLHRKWRWECVVHLVLQLAVHRLLVVEDLRLPVVEDLPEVHQVQLL